MAKVKFIMSCSVLLFSVAVLNAQTNISHYKIADKFHVQGDGGWDCLAVDDSTGRLFLSHATAVQVLDTKTGKLAGTIPNTIGVHGIALAHDLNKGFISNGKDSSVTIFNLKTLEQIAKVPVTGKNPDGIIYDGYSHLVFVFNGKSSSTTVIDAKTNKAVATIALDGKPEFPASDEKGTVYVTIEDKSLVDVINTKTLKVDKNWSVAPGEEPSGLAIDNETARLFIGCGNKMMVIADAMAGKVIATQPIGDHCDGVAFDPVSKRAFSSCGDGTLAVVQEVTKDTFRLIENVPTQKGARTLAIDSKTHHIFLPTADFGPAPAETAENPKPRPAILPNTFVVLDVETLK